MGFTFTDGNVATAAQLNQAIGPIFQTGIAKITPVANTLTDKRITYPSPFAVAPSVLITPASTVAGSTVRGWSVINSGTSGFTIRMYRTNTTNTYFHWVAALSPTAFTTGGLVPASLLNQGAGGLVTQSGTVSITPISAGDPRSVSITFPDPFAATPVVFTTALATVPDLILGTGATSPTATGCKIWLCRNSTTATTVQWIAVGRM